MKILLRAIGKNHDPIYKDGIDLFTKRISHYYPVDWLIAPPAKTPSGDQAIFEETQSLIKSRQSGEVIIALDERGKQFDSKGIADLIETQSIRSAKTLIWAIGGAYGFDQRQLKDLDYTISLSRLTFPHQLVRLILAEQIYRACTILRGEKYHHQ